MHPAAERLEQAAISGSAALGHSAWLEYKSASQAFASFFAPLAGKLLHQQRATEPFGESGVVDHDRALDLLSELELTIQRNYAGAMRITREISGLLAGTVLQVEALELSGLVDDFEEDQALACLAALSKKLKDMRE